MRYSTWSAFVGSAFLHVAFYGGNQVQIQRYLTVSTPIQARRMLWINTVGWTLVVLLTVYAGLLIFTHYITCNPFESKKVTVADELFPLYVMETFKDLPGFPGLFLAGVFSAGLSTVSAGVNSLAALWIDELRGWMGLDVIWEKRSGMIAKILSFFFGVLSFLLVFLVPYLGGLASVSISLSGIFTGTLFGIFCLGMFLPRANNAGAMAGLTGSIIILMWLATGSVMFSAPPVSTYSKLQIPVTGCNSNYSSSVKLPAIAPFSSSSQFSIYQISFLWHPMLACVLTVVIGIIASEIANYFGIYKNNQRGTRRSKKNINGFSLNGISSTNKELQSSEPFLQKGSEIY